MKLASILVMFASLSIYANSVTVSVERDEVCKHACNAEIAGQHCVAKGGAFSGLNWLPTEWVSNKVEAKFKKFRIIPSTQSWVSIKQLKMFIKNEAGETEESIIYMALNRLHNCEALIISMQKETTMTDIEMLVRGSAEQIDIAIEPIE